MKTTPLFAIAAIAALFATGCGRGGGGGLATVNGEAISAEDFHKYLETKETVTISTGSGVGEARVVGSLAFQALKDLVARQLLMQLAKDEGVLPKDEDIIAELEVRKKLNPNYVKQVTQGGMTIQRLKEDIMVGLAREGLLTKGITVGMDEVDKYIANNKEAFMDPARADMQWVFVKSADKKAEVDKELATGQPFVSVAQRFSEFPKAREEQGRFPQNEVRSMQSELQKIISETAELKVSDWLPLSDGFAKFYIQKKTAAKPITMDENRKKVVQRQLAQERGAQAVDLNKRISDKLKNSKIEISDVSLKEPWKRAMDELKKATPDAPKTPDTETAGG